MIYLRDSKMTTEEYYVPVEEQLREDRLIYGSAFWVMIEGNKIRIDPSRVMITAPGWYTLMQDGPCLKCGKDALDTGWECNECGFDNKPFYYPEGESKVKAA